MRYELLIKEFKKDEVKVAECDDFNEIKKQFNEIIKEHTKYEEVEILDNNFKYANGRGMCAYSLSLLRFRGDI